MGCNPIFLKLMSVICCAENKTDLNLYFGQSDYFLPKTTVGRGHKSVDGGLKRQWRRKMNIFKVYIDMYYF